MKDKDRVNQVIDDIKSTEDPREAIKKLADLTREIGLEACRERETIRSLTEKNRLALIGDGNPEHSVLGRLVSVEKKVDIFTKDICDIKDLLVGGLTHSNNPSLKSRIEKFEDYAKRSEKIQWLILSAIIGYVVYQILAALL